MPREDTQPTNPPGRMVRAMKEAIAQAIPVERGVIILNDPSSRPDPACIQDRLPRDRRATRDELYRAYQDCVREKAV